MSISQSNTFSVTVQAAPTGELAYMAATPVGAVKSLANTIFNNFVELPQYASSGILFGGAVQIIDAWGCIAYRKNGKRVIAFGGGHNNYGGNEVMELDMGIDAPTWRTIKSRTPEAQIVPNVRRMGDGQPVSRHTYYDCHFIDQLDEFITVGTYAVFSSGVGPSGGTDHIERFDYATKSWLAVGLCPPSTGAGGPWGKAKHPVTEEVWWLDQNHRFRKYNPFTLTTTDTGFVSIPGIHGTERATVIDASRNRMVFSRRRPDPNLPNNGVGEWFHVNLTTRVATQMNLTGAQISSASGGALLHDTIGDRYLYVDTQSRVFAIDPTTYVVTQLTFTGDTWPTTAVASPWGQRVIFDETIKGLVAVPRGTANAVYVRLYA
jgi:hypothetical protein